MVQTMEVHLKRFRPSTMQTNRICVMIGKKGTGKSTLVEEIMWFQQNIPVGTIMSATEEANEAYSKMVPPLFIYKEFDATALERLINRQKKMKAMYKQNGDSLPFDHRAFLLIDDCMYDKKNFRSPLIRQLFMNGRHWDLFVLITIQYLMDITPEIRTNTDYIFALKENIRNNREKMYKEFFGVFPSFAVFDELFLEVTQDFRCLVLDNTVPSTKIEDCVFWYKAKKRPEFRLGSQWYWDYSAKHMGDGKKKAEASEQLAEMRSKAVRVVYETGEPSSKPSTQGPTHGATPRPPISTHGPRQTEKERPMERDERSRPRQEGRQSMEREAERPRRQNPRPEERPRSPPRNIQRESNTSFPTVQFNAIPPPQRAAFSAPRHVKQTFGGFV